QQHRARHAEQREQRAHRTPPEILRDQASELHFASSASISCSLPLSSRIRRVPNSAARGSCVTITIVLPRSVRRRLSSVSTPSADSWSRFPVGSSASKSG